LRLVAFGGRTVLAGTIVPGAVVAVAEAVFTRTIVARAIITGTVITGTVIPGPIIAGTVVAVAVAALGTVVAVAPAVPAALAIAVAVVAVSVFAVAVAVAVTVAALEAVATLLAALALGAFALGLTVALSLDDFRLFGRLGLEVDLVGGVDVLADDVGDRTIRLDGAQDAEVVLGVLQVVFSEHPVARRRGVARQLLVLFVDALGRAAHLHAFRTVRVERAVSVVLLRLAAVATAIVAAALALHAFEISHVLF
jgi:hypothetical protein